MEGLAGILTSVGSVLTAEVGWVGSVVSTIAETPILFVGFAIGLSFTAVRMFRALR